MKDFSVGMLGAVVEVFGLGDFDELANRCYWGNYTYVSIVPQ
jgi:hypothetical protein